MLRTSVYPFYRAASNDGLSHPCQWCAVIDLQFTVHERDAQGAPQLLQIELCCRSPVAIDELVCAASIYRLAALGFCNR